jgi:hypothetical protein
MSAPSNDNWASGPPVSLNQPVSGTNVSATSETGEPANNGASVWYSFTSGLAGLINVSTRASDVIPLMLGTSIFSPAGNNFPGTPTNFLSKVQVFKSATNFPGAASSVSDLVEVNYVEQFNQDNLGPPFQGSYLNAPYENADVVSFTAAQGAIYYIRVDSRNAGAVNTGNFLLSVFTCCTRECPESFDTNDFINNETALSSTTITATAVTSLGTFAKGRYVVIMKSGGFIYEGLGCQQDFDSYTCNGVSFTTAAGPFTPQAPGCGPQLPFAAALVNGCLFLQQSGIRLCSNQCAIPDH